MRISRSTGPDCIGLYLFEISEFLYQLLLPKAWKADRELYVVASAFAAEDEAGAVFFVTDVGAGDK